MQDRILTSFHNTVRIKCRSGSNSSDSSDYFLTDSAHAWKWLAQRLRISSGRSSLTFWERNVSYWSRRRFVRSGPGWASASTMSTESRLTSGKMFLTIKRNSLVKRATNVLFGIDILFLEMSIINSQGCNSLKNEKKKKQQPSYLTVWLHEWQYVVVIVEIVIVGTDFLLFGPVLYHVFSNILCNVELDSWQKGFDWRSRVSETFETHQLKQKSHGTDLFLLHKDVRSVFNF